MRDEEPVAHIGGCHPPCCADEHRTWYGVAGTARRGLDLPGDLGARGLGSRGGLGKEREDPEVEGGGGPEAQHERLARAQARPERDVADFAPDCVPPYPCSNAYKDSMVFFSTDFAQTAAKL
jgi:hypothetical protein